MSAFTPWKVHDENEKHIASCCNATVAACLVSYIGNAKWTITYRTTGCATTVVWSEQDGPILAGTVDRDATLMYQRNEKAQAEWKVRSAERFAAFNEENRRRNIEAGRPEALAALAKPGGPK